MGLIHTLGIAPAPGKAHGIKRDISGQHRHALVCRLVDPRRGRNWRQRWRRARPHVPDDGLPARMHVDVLHPDRLLALAPVLVERLDEGGIGPCELVRLADASDEGEPGEDSEPSLGWTGHDDQSSTGSAKGGILYGDDEPSLGWTTDGQCRGALDLEEVNDGEPNLGWGSHPVALDASFNEGEPVVLRWPPEENSPL